MIEDIDVKAKAVAYIKQHKLDEPFKKSVLKLLAGNNAGLDLKKRQPKSDDIWSFRITKKYRAFARKRGAVLTVYAIDDHQ